MEKKFQTMMEEFENKCKEMNENYNDLKVMMFRMTRSLEQQKNDTEKIVSILNQYRINDSELVKLNIGGKLFTTYKSTLTKRIKKPNIENEYFEPHLLTALLSGVIPLKLDENEAIFIDRDPTYFHIILNYLRYANTNINYKLPDSFKILELIKRECDFYKLQSLYDEINKHLGDYVVGGKIYINSHILSNEQFDFLVELCDLPFMGKWILIYRGSTHGFSSTEFHSKCDDKSQTLTIVKTTLSYVFGGYTSKEWSSKGGWKYDENALIFSLLNNQNEPIVMKCSQPQYAIYCNIHYGPTFGGGHSIYVSNSSNVNFLSHSNIGYTYKHPSIEHDSDKARSFLAGSYHFQTSEIEAFKFESDETVR